MQIHDLNTKALTNPAYVAFDDGEDTYKADFKMEIDNAAASAVADADLTDNTVAFTSGDAASPTTWTAVSVLTSGLTIKELFNRISTMIKNVRYIWNLLGSSSFSNVASTLTGAIGNTALTTTAQTLSGAIAEHESDISTLNSNLATSLSGGNGVIYGSWPLYKRGNIVFLQVDAIASAPAGNTSLGIIIPSGYRPAANINFTLIRRANISSSIILALTISQTGEAAIYNYGSAISSATPFGGLFSWPVA